MFHLARIASWFVCLAAPLAARQSADDYLAPANRWTTAGGCPARSGATRTRALRGPVEVDWTKDAKGTVEGEPLVWDDLVVVTVVRAPDLRVLRVFDLTSGDQVGTDRVVRTTLPLGPSLWRNVVAYRAGPKELVAVRIGERRMTEVWSTTTEGTVGPPLLVSDRVYAASDGAFVCHAINRREALWKCAGSYFGAPALVGDELTVVKSSDGRAGMALISAATGSERDAVSLHSMAVDHAASVVALPGGLCFVDFASTMKQVDGKKLTMAGLRITADAFEHRTLEYSTLARSLPTASDDGWLAKMVAKDGTTVLVYKLAQESDPAVLAAATLHPEFVSDDLPATVAGSVAYVGARAFELDTKRILWHLPIHATQRPVLAREAVLLVDQGQRIVAVRSKARRVEAPTAGASEASAMRGLVVLRDGSIERGEFTFDAAAQRVARTTAKGSDGWGLAEVMLIEDEQHAIRGGSDPVRALHFVVEDELRVGYVDLAKRARTCNSSGTIDKFLGLATVHGADDKDLAESRKVADRLRERDEPARVRADQVKELEAQGDELARRPALALLERMRALPEDRKASLDTKLLRAALDVEPKNEQVQAAVRALLPAELEAGARFDARDALAFVEARRRTPVKFLTPPKQVDATVKGDLYELGWRAGTPEKRGSWRSDLYAVRSANLLIITPVKKPGTLARCLAFGELVCDTLRNVVAGGAPPGPADKPMLIELFATRDEYLKLSGHGHGRHDQSAGLSWTGGHYDMRDNVSRFYFPDSDEELDQVLATAAHELTHHWLSTRCPLWTTRTMSLEDLTQPGYWVVEGFASLLEDFAFDVEHWTAIEGGVPSLRLDLLANAGVQTQIPWNLELGLSHVEFARMPLEQRPDVQTSLYLGASQRVNSLSLFYAQAAATARYLYSADDGALRPKLIEYLRAFYTNDVTKLDLPKLVGLEADDLGRRIDEFARRVVEQS